MTTLYVWTTGASRALLHNQPTDTIPISLVVSSEIVPSLAESEPLCQAIGDQIAVALHANGTRIADHIDSLSVKRDQEPTTCQHDDSSHRRPDPATDSDT